MGNDYSYGYDFLVAQPASKTCAVRRSLVEERTHQLSLPPLSLEHTRTSIRKPHISHTANLV